MGRAIEFLLNHHAQLSADIQTLQEAQKITTATVESLAKQAEEDQREMRETFESLFDRMREGFDKLILANEITRDLIRLLGYTSEPAGDSLRSRRNLRHILRRFDRFPPSFELTARSTNP